MATVTVDAPTPRTADASSAQHHPLQSSLSRGRRTRNRLANAWMILSLAIAAVPLLAVLVVLVVKGAGLIASTDWWTESIPSNVAANAFGTQEAQDAFGNVGTVAKTEEVVYGMQPAIVGTLLTTGLAALLSIPLGIAAAVYLNEYGGKNRSASTIRFFTDVMTGVPSVVMGIFVYTVWVLNFEQSGRSGLAGGLALACLMLPVVVRSAEEMLRLVPNSLREASAALGTPKWKTTTRVVLPAAMPGITSGAMLAIARAAGETAPILFTVGVVSATNFSLFGQNTTLSAQIFSNATQPGGESIAWGAALTLIVVVMAFTLAARFVSSKFAVRIDQ
ncbi:MAG TPA: phosphate ABC transporter permease PstA [Microthrixaceae bacterium]|nr:phosphate ABC transporter permease PstA [Microthrixaceae bacterium]HNI35153.1 phosphate ABC transporter permease PstA [Microthrixaceae bacterium]